MKYDGFRKIYATAAKEFARPINIESQWLISRLYQFVAASMLPLKTLSFKRIIGGNLFNDNFSNSIGSRLEEKIS